MRAIQWLLTARGYPVTVDGVFGEPTRAAVDALETAASLPPDGIVDDATWAKLIIPIGAGATGAAVKAAQYQLRAKRHLDVAVDGVYGARHGRGGQDVPAPRPHHAERHHERHDLAPAHRALRAAVVQQDLAVRLQRRQRQGELGDVSRDQPAGGRRRFAAAGPRSRRDR